MRILIIDDEPGIRDMLTFVLRQHGHAVETACDGLDGLELVRRQTYDLIFLDVHMPRLAGPETFKAIRELRPAQSVVIFSSGSDPDYAFESRAQELGALACIYKPCDIREILKIIDSLAPGGGETHGS